MKKILIILALAGLLYGMIYLVQHMNRQVGGYNEQNQQGADKSSQEMRKALGR